MMTDTKRWRPTSKFLLLGCAMIFILLAIPLLAMTVTDEVGWDVFDFTVAASLMLFALGALWLVLFLSSDLRYRLAGLITISGVFLLIWVTGAIGIIGAADNDANLLFGVVVAIALVGSLGTMGKPGGMRFVLWTMALGQAAVCALALLLNWAGPNAHAGEIMVGGGAFVAAFAFAGALFHLSARTRQSDAL